MRKFILSPLNDRVKILHNRRSMSNHDSQHMANSTFIDRFVEACGSSKPAFIKRLLDISYQSAKNYLSGRVPSPEILVVLSERTSYSIDWLLTGRGKKFTDESPISDTPISAGQMRAFVREVCVEVINERLGEKESAPKTFKLQSGDLMAEKVMGESISFPASKDYSAIELAEHLPPEKI